MCIQIQEEDFGAIEDKIKEVIELARDVVRGGSEEIGAAFSIAMRCREIQKILDEGKLCQAN